MNLAEIAVIVVVAIVVLGPQRLPELARKAGQWMQVLQNLIHKMKNEFDLMEKHATLEENKLRAHAAEATDTKNTADNTSEKIS